MWMALSEQLDTLDAVGLKKVETILGGFTEEIANRKKVAAIAA